MRRWLLCVTLAACSDRAAPAGPPPEPTRPGKREPVAVAVAVDPSTGLHLDDSGGRPTAPEPPPGRGAHPIDVTLRSTPTGAQAFVDGVPVGTTPTFWSGQADGRAHEFTFEQHGYALARYRFVPVTSGVVHARLEPIAEDADAGVPPPELAPTPPNAGAALVNPPPAPIVAPDAAMPPDATPSARGPLPF